MPASMKHRFEYALLRAGLLPLRVLPLRAALALAWMVAWIMHRILRFRAAEARRRIHLVLGPDLPEREARRIAWISWRNLCFNVVEMARFPTIARGRVDDIIDDFDPVREKIKELRADGNGLVLATMHMGNWELGGLAVTMEKLPLFVVARRQKNELSNDYLLRIRRNAGFDIVLNDDRLMRNIIRRLKRGDILAILPDVRARTPALKIDFLGGQANIGGGMGMFARQTNLPILPAYELRSGWTRHKWHLLEPVYPDPSLEKRADWQRMTQEIMTRFSELVRRHPEQYFWYNKRWVLDPLED